MDTFCREAIFWGRLGNDYNGNIILDDIVGHIELSVFQQIDIADHVLVIGKVVDLNIDDNKKPLIYYRSQYQDLK